MKKTSSEEHRKERIHFQKSLITQVFREGEQSRADRKPIMLIVGGPIQLNGKKVMTDVGHLPNYIFIGSPGHDDH